MTQEEYLAHHGILGQKWGVRRYQNSDGTLTAAGKKRYSRQLYRKLRKPHDQTESSKVRMKINNDPEFLKARNAYEKAEAHTFELERRGLSANSNERKKALEAQVNAYVAMHGTYFSAIKKHRPELFSATLKEIGEDDTAVGREVINEILSEHDKQLGYYLKSMR